MKKFLNKPNLIKALILKSLPIFVFLFGMDSLLWAQFDQSDVSIQGGAFTPYVRAAGTVMISVGAIVFLYAAIKTYNNWQAGQSGVFAQVQNMLLGSFALLAVGTFIYTMFGI